MRRQPRRSTSIYENVLTLNWQLLFISSGDGTSRVRILIYMLFTVALRVLRSRVSTGVVGSSMLVRQSNCGVSTAAKLLILSHNTYTTTTPSCTGSQSITTTSTTNNIHAGEDYISYSTNLLSSIKRERSVPWREVGRSVRCKT